MTSIGRVAAALVGLVALPVLASTPDHSHHHPPASEAGTPGDPHAGHEMEERAAASPSAAASSNVHHDMHHGMRMEIVDGGIVSNANTDELPKDCPTIRAEHRFVVEAGREMARAHPGTTFAYDAPEWRVEPCSRVTVTLRNHDRVRHQWMVHGLPAYLYPMGMFTVTADGGSEVTGTFVVSSEPDTLLVHCDVAGHMEQGMKGQLRVAGGRGDLPSIPGRSAPRHADPHDVAHRLWLWGLAGLCTAVAFVFARRR